MDKDIKSIWMHVHICVNRQYKTESNECGGDGRRGGSTEDSKLVKNNKVNIYFVCNPFAVIARILLLFVKCISTSTIQGNIGEWHLSKQINAV